MASVFGKAPEPEQSVIDIVRDTLDVNGEGQVSFRTRRGRGSGAAVEVPGEEFNEFVELLNATRDSREALAQQQRDADAAAAQAVRAKANAAAENTTDESDTSSDESE